MTARREERGRTLQIIALVLVVLDILDACVDVLNVHVVAVVLDFHDPYTWVFVVLDLVVHHIYLFYHLTFHPIPLPSLSTSSLFSFYIICISLLLQAKS